MRSTTDSTKTGFLRRKIQDVSFSLSKFKDTVTGREYSPLYRFSGNSTLIQKYTDTNTSLDANGQLSSGAEILNQGIRVVTVEESEEELNDRNRYVKILRPELLGQLTSELKFTLRD